MIRGGASRKSSASRKSAPKPTTSRRRSKAYDDDNDDDDEVDEPVRAPAKKPAAKAKGYKRGAAKGNQFMQMVPWGNAKGKGKGKKGPGIALGLREKFEELAKTGQSAYKDVYRRAKVMKSSAFEGMLLRATWPGNDAVPQELLDEIIKHSIPAFKYGKSVRDCYISCFGAIFSLCMLLLFGIASCVCCIC
jgi:hypothetical protein